MTFPELFFVLLLAISGYTFVGYPVVIWAMARLRALPVGRGEFLPDIAVVIVAHNEAERISSKVESCLTQEYPASKVRILVVSDGSTDETEHIVRGIHSSRVDFLGFEERRGKAACLNEAISRCPEPLLVLTDARQRLAPDAVINLVRNFADPRVGAASGELVFEADDLSGFGKTIDTYWRLEKFIRENESRFNSVIGVTGALYALRNECFRPIPEGTILDDVVIPMQVVLLGKRVIFERHAIAYDRASATPEAEAARKVRTASGNFQMFFGHREFLSPFQNPVFFQFVSHKLLRVVAPYFLVMLLAINIYIAGESLVYVTTLILQLGLYGAAVCGLAWPSSCRFRLVSLARSFVLLNWTAVRGLIDFATNRHGHLWR